MKGCKHTVGKLHATYNYFTVGGSRAMRYFHDHYHNIDNIVLSPSARADQRNRQGDIIVIIV